MPQQLWITHILLPGRRPETRVSRTGGTVWTADLWRSRTPLRAPSLRRHRSANTVTHTHTQPDPTLISRTVDGEEVLRRPEQVPPSHLTPRADLPVGRVRAFPEEAGPSARGVGPSAAPAGWGGVGMESLGGGGHRAGDHTLLVARTAAGGALKHTQEHTPKIFPNESQTSVLMSFIPTSDHSPVIHTW